MKTNEEHEGHIYFDEKNEQRRQFDEKHEKKERTSFKSIFKRLSSINLEDVNGKSLVDKKQYISKKSGKKITLNYLSWANCLNILCNEYEDIRWQYLECKQDDGSTSPLFSLKPANKGYFVKTRLIIEGHIREMHLAIFNNENLSVLQPDSMQINKSILRCLVKNASLFGLGLYLYAGEDLPSLDQEDNNQLFRKLEATLKKINSTRDLEAFSLTLKNDCKNLDASSLNRLRALYANKRAELESAKHIEPGTFVRQTGGLE